MMNFRERILEQVPPGTSRREFLKLMGAVVVMGSLEGCREHDPIEEVIPYARTSETALGGPYTHFATSMNVCDSVLGVLVTAHQGRPIKIEGNPRHPFGRGTTNAFAQGALYDLYDPHRASQITFHGEETRDWPQFRRAMAAATATAGAQAAPATAGEQAATAAGTHAGAEKRIRIVMNGAVRSPTDERLLAAVPHSQVTRINSVNLPVRDFSRADTVVLFDDDRFGWSAEGLKEARDWMERRSVDRPDFARGNAGARMFVAEPTWTFAGGVADERVPVRRSRIPLLVQALLDSHGASSANVPSGSENASALNTQERSQNASALNAEETAWVAQVREAMKSGHTVFGAGPSQPPQVHEAIARLNNELAQAAEPSHDLKDLLIEMRSGLVDVLVILGGNPAYDAPEDFASALKQVKTSVYLGAYVNETSRLCSWHVPQAHDLEMWGDYTNADGSMGIVQPLIAPLYNGRTIKEVLSVLIDGEKAKDAYTLTRETYRSAHKDEFEFETWWKKQLASGVTTDADVAHSTNAVHTDVARRNLLHVKNTKLPNAESPAAQTASARQTVKIKSPEILEAGAFELAFAHDYATYDGRYANNAWLQELPRPFTELTWDNAAIISTETAQRLKIETGDMIKITAGSKSIELVALAQDGLPLDQIVLHLGYGSRTTGIGAGVGVDVNPLRTSESPWSRLNVKVEKTNKRFALAITQKNSKVEDPAIDRVITRTQLAKANPTPKRESAGMTKDPSTPKTLDDRPQRWGMVIDLDTCIGCKTCTIACQVENNIPVVGKRQVLMGREMHWIRIDRYTRGEGAKTKFDPQPVPCMQCEKAPCEVVCPVNASVHSSDGLNQQVYNRCIGTRFCANNCPYKVRRFNFLKYTGFDQEPALRAVYNPDVTVRWRGVMEKCTYCVQRINRARLTAEIAHETLKAPETACQQACPTKAIVFGDLNDDTNLLRKLKQLPREYSLLEELGTKPRTTYLSKVERV